jgi:hypothetical protein
MLHLGEDGTQGRQSVSLPCPFDDMQKPFERDRALHSDIGIYERDLDGISIDADATEARKSLLVGNITITIRVKEAEDFNRATLLSPLRYLEVRKDCGEGRQPAQFLGSRRQANEVRL